MQQSGGCLFEIVSQTRTIKYQRYGRVKCKVTIFKKRYIIKCVSNILFGLRSNLAIGGLAFGNKLDAPVYVSQEGGVVGLNFHQSKEVLITDSINGSAFTVSTAHYISYTINLQ